MINKTPIEIIKAKKYLNIMRRVGGARLRVDLSGE
jgi:hypothetical protein